ncbi:hypothetical protein [Mesorhizobium comanense]|uniref:hypothetical protein n=1 Tax=Mesorhizobium comanense TaxID=2502215 RepID=UPI0014850E20|nr:hypothetical protein [Mesorhizobium comanense]
MSRIVTDQLTAAESRIAPLLRKELNRMINECEMVSRRVRIIKVLAEVPGHSD